MIFDIFDDDFDFEDAMDLAGAIGIAQEECEEALMATQNTPPVATSKYPTQQG
jgi:hypothetical protein